MDMDLNTSTKVQEILEKIHHLVDQEQYSEAADLIDEHRLFLQKNADMKSQNQMNKTYAQCMFHRIKDTYSVDKNEEKFMALFEKHRGLIEVHHKKSDYLNLLKIYDKIKRKRKNKVIGILLSVVFLFAVSFFFLNSKGLLANFSTIRFTAKTGSPEEKTEPPLESTTTTETSSAIPSTEPTSSSEKNKPETSPATSTPENKTPSQETTDSTPTQETENQTSVNTQEKPFVAESDSVTTENLPADSEYLLNSDSKILTLDDVKNMNADDIRMAINEMYARHGYYFGGYNQKYFESKSWYKVDTSLTNPADATKNFSEIERTNLSFLVNRERRLKGN